MYSSRLFLVATLKLMRHIMVWIWSLFGYSRVQNNDLYIVHDVFQWLILLIFLFISTFHKLNHKISTYYIIHRPWIVKLFIDSTPTMQFINNLDHKLYMNIIIVHFENENTSNTLKLKRILNARHIIYRLKQKIQFI